MAKDESALRRLGGGRWQTRDGRFAIEPQSGTWVIVDAESTDELGLPLVRGPFASLTSAKEAIAGTSRDALVSREVCGEVLQRNSGFQRSKRKTRIHEKEPKALD